MRSKRKDEALEEKQEHATAPEQEQVHAPVKSGSNEITALLRKVNSKRRSARKPFAYLLHSVEGKHQLFRCPWHLLHVITPQWVDEHKGPPTSSEIMNGTTEQVTAYLEAAYESD